MQITCDNCNKSFNLNETLIPKEGRYLQCGSCDHKWFFKHEKDKKKIIHKKIKKDETIIDLPENNKIQINEPQEKKLSKENNPPKFKVEFFENQRNIENINCYSNEGDKWMKSNIKLVEKELTIEFREPFLPRRGRINCSVNDNGKWRWFGTQFIIR